MDLKKVAASLTDAITELRTEKEPNAAIGSAMTEIVAALRIVKGQMPPAIPAPAAPPPSAGALSAGVPAATASSATK